MMLSPDSTFLVVVDVQEKLARAMHERQSLLESTVRLVKGAKILGLPTIWSEQNPKGLGATLPELAELLTETPPVTKLSFSCCGEVKFVEQLQEIKRKQALVAGIECHVCVYQTVMDLLRMGYEVHVVADAVSSRTPENKAIGLGRCKELGASVTSTEMALFELLRVAEGDKFKQMLKVVK
jgi:nicotinamidase-related amidase